MHHRRPPSKRGHNHRMPPGGAASPANRRPRPPAPSPPVRICALSLCEAFSSPTMVAGPTDALAEIQRPKPATTAYHEHRRAPTTQHKGVSIVLGRKKEPTEYGVIIPNYIKGQPFLSFFPARGVFLTDACLPARHLPSLAPPPGACLTDQPGLACLTSHLLDYPPSLISSVGPLLSSRYRLFLSKPCTTTRRWP